MYSDKILQEIYPIGIHIEAQECKLAHICDLNGDYPGLSYPSVRVPLTARLVAQLPSGQRHTLTHLFCCLEELKAKVPRKKSNHRNQYRDSSVVVAQKCATMGDKLESRHDE